MVEIIYENEDWLPFFKEALDEIKVDYRLNFIDEFELDLNATPDDIIYLNRVSPSSHTRGHNQAAIRGEQYLEYLAAFNRRVINGIHTISIELSKVEQHALLKRFGVNFPQTVAGSEHEELIKAAESLQMPILTKHNCSGKGLGITMIENLSELQNFFEKNNQASPDGIWLLQEYIKPKNNYVTRVEILNGELVYAFRSATDQGFELCPADACRIDSDKISAAPDSADALFTYVPDFEHPLVEKYIELCQASKIDMAGIEFVEGANGAVYTYDINCTTNYSSDVEKQSGYKAKKAFQKFIKSKL